METTDQNIANLHKNVGGELKAMCQPSQTVPAHEQPVLGVKDVAEIAGYALRSGIEETLSGKGPDTEVRVTPGKRLGRWVVDRVRKMRGAFQKK